MTLIEEHRARPAAESGWLVCLVVCLSCSCDGTGSSDGGSDADADGDGDTDTDADMDSDTDSDSDTDTETETETQPWTCEGEDVWEDQNTGLCWMKNDAWCPDEERYCVSWPNAQSLCTHLEWGGYSDWRLPRIHELIDLIRGCPSSFCQVSDPGCLHGYCNDTDECGGCDIFVGPGVDGCYWPIELGSCVMYWSQSALAEYEHVAWYMIPVDATVGTKNKYSNCSYTRCVRGE
jgi:hypothetical protein